MKLIKLISGMAVMMAIIAFSSCVKDEVDNPPDYGTDPALTVNKTIASLKAIYTVGNNPMVIDSDWVVKGVVVGDDHAGNFYKSIVIQDSTGGINIQLDQSDYHTFLQLGRNVYVKCKGLVIGNYGEMVQLGGYIDNVTSVGRIPQSLIPQHLIGGMWNQSIAAKTVSNFDLWDPILDQNKLVRLENVHFDGSAVCLPWAEIDIQQSGNRKLLDNFGNFLYVRTSNFTTFATNKVPGGTGAIVGVFQIYNNDLQFVLRDLSDVEMDAPPENVSFGSVHSLAEVRTIFSQCARIGPAGSSVTGIVISERSNGSIDSKNVAIQDSTGGIVVRFTAAHAYNLGDKVTIDISDEQLFEYNGLLEVNNVPPSKAVLVSTGNSVTPRQATTAEVNTNAEAWESTLVQILNVTISGAGPTFNQSTTLTDATGTLTMYTRAQASFSGTNYPVTPVDVTGIISDFNATQINIRTLSDVQ